MKQKPSKSESIDVVVVNKARVSFCLLGVTPLILHSMDQKVENELLLPRKKTAAERAATLKHNPFAEFRGSIDKSKTGPTVIVFPATAFKKAISSACLDIPGSASKAQIGRLTYVAGYSVPIYGKPQLHMGVVRMADMAKTPDIRTRAILAEWATIVTVEFVVPILQEKTIGNLMGAAGMMQGIGDWRVSKGSGDHGQWEIVDPKNKDFLRIMKLGRKDQQAAIDHPEPYDERSARLLTFFVAEAKRRGFDPESGEALMSYDELETSSEVEETAEAAS